MKVFVSSVRRGLEEERDALPGLISAVGHQPLRFEDYTAQSIPSREACLAGVAAADVYLLILGPNYGHRFDDTGQSPTHDEWAAASAAGLPRLVYRKNGVIFEPDQETFAQHIGDYTSGVFYDTYTTTAELLTKVAAKIRELDQAGSPLAFSPLTSPVTVTWRVDFEKKQYTNVSSRPMLELHVVPIGTQPRSSRTMGKLADSLASRLRESKLIDASDSLSATRSDGAIVILSAAPKQTDWDAVRSPRFVGVRVDAGGQVSIWATLPGDAMGTILDPSQLPEQIASLLRLIGTLRIIESSQVAIGIGIDPTRMLSVGRVEQLPRQSTFMLMSDHPIRVEPDELMTVAALDAGALEVARPLSRALLDGLGALR